MATIRSQKLTSSPGDGSAAAELEAFCRFCRDALTAEDGRPFVVEGFQRMILADYFAGRRELVVLISKKNGKSSLLAAVAIWHLLSTPFAEALIVAAARDQAGIILRQVTGFIRRSQRLRARLRVVQREVRAEELDGRLRVLASDVDTVDGQLPTFVAIDELHRHRKAELYGILRDSLGARDGQLVAISTAGDDQGSPLGLLRAKARAMDGLERDGAHWHVRDANFAYHEWALDPEDDFDDLAVVKRANPASWITEEELDRRRTASMQPWQWARFTCGLWIVGEHSAIDRAEWEACADPGCDIPAGSEGVRIGIDLGWRVDCTAVVPVWQERGGFVRRQVRPGAYVREPAPADGPTIIGEPAILTPPGDGGSLSVETVFSVCATMAERWPGCVFVLDPAAGGQLLAERLEAELPGVTVATYSQSHGSMCRASANLAAAIASGLIRHPADEELDRHVLAAGVRQVGEQWRFEKQGRHGPPVDAVIALAMAYATEPPAARPQYRSAGF